MPATGSAGFRDPGAVMRCSQCRHENPGDAKFCLECGRRLALMCSACATELPADATFCKECGAPVGTSTAAPSRTPAPASYTPKHLAERFGNSTSISIDDLGYLVRRLAELGRFAEAELRRR